VTVTKERPNIEKAVKSRDYQRW